MQKILRKSAVILLSLLLTVSIFAGCSFFDRIQKQIDHKTGSVCAPELIRLLVNAIDDPSSFSETYEELPESQREALSFTNFVEYVTILHELSSPNGKIEGFEFLNDEENSDHLNKLYNKLCQQMPAESFEEYFDKYGNIRTVRLLYSGEAPDPLYLYICVDGDDFAHLSSEWVNDTISNYNYLRHYFNMIDSGNVDAIAGLIKNTKGFTAQNVSYPDEFYQAKAEYIEDFYKYRVRNTTDRFDLTSANALYVNYFIPEVIAADGQSYFSRNVTSYRSSSGEISIADDISQETDMSIATVNVSPILTLRCGSVYEYSTLTRICGKPLSVYVPYENLSEEYDADGNLTVRKRLVIQYNGLSLVFEAGYTDEKNWVGELVSIRIVKNSKTNFSCCDIKVGDDELTVIKRFPMLEYGNYNLNYDAGSKLYRLEYIMKDGIVDSIHITCEEK